jgi:transposase
MTRKAYPSDVTDDEWAFIAPYLTLKGEDAPQREYALREVFNGVRWVVRTGAQWRMMPNDLPPWYTVYQQAHAYRFFMAHLHVCMGRASLLQLTGNSHKANCSLADCNEADYSGPTWRDH